ncbi:MAG TPA: amino acid adenylation domain-containing protein [Thermoanaerobaculia bacterium]
MSRVSAGLEGRPFRAEPEDTARFLQGVTLLHQAFERRAAAEPEAVVLVAGEERITCGELESRANRLARFLAAQGVGPEVRVAVCAERTPDLVVALYAVLKAGGAYVPVDPAYPEERQAAILGDSGALLLLTQERLTGRLPHTSARPVLLDRDWPEIERYGGGPFDCPAGERNLAYVIYTSGSTGRPKGVAIEHHSAVTLTRWAARIYSPEELSGVLAATSVCFDMSIFELFVTPALGGRAILADHALSLPELPAAGEVTLVNTVPSAIAELARSGGIPPSVVTVNLGGEALRAALVNRLHETGTIRKVYNVYGPSEDTTFSTWALVPPGDTIPSVGNLLDGEWGYLLDRDLQQVPGDGPGELYIGGAGLSRGYLGRPDMTAARYVPDPYATRPGERIYATGDLIRYRPDGELDYLGRLDHQVKIRGHRVELGEIEATLERHPAVGDTVVVALDLSETGEAAEKVLAAYVVARQGMELSVAGLREHVRERLAEYMVPTYFVVMAALPLSPNGKVDRKALPRPEISGERPGFVAPRDPLEAALAEIWSEVLSVSAVGIQDHFFELGGHSLLAARVIARIHETLGRRLPPRALFDAPTVERLAALMTGLTAGEELAGIPLAKDRRWIASPGQEGMWFAERLHPELPLFTIPLQLDLTGPLDRGALQRSLAAVVCRHQTLRVVFSEVNGGPELAPADAVVGLPRIDLRALPAPLREGEAERATAALAATIVSLQHAPLLQGYLLERGERDHRLLILMHHIVGDDWSTWVLANDLAAFYAAEMGGRPAALPPLPVQLSDYAAWQREWLAGEEARAQLAFWRRRLAGSPDLLDLPADRPRPPVQSFVGGLASAEIPPRDLQALRKAALEAKSTLFMALLAALDVLLYRLSGQPDLNVGASVANRHRQGTQGLIGLFTNNLVLRADLSGNPSFAGLLGQVRETVLSGMERQDFPFDQLVKELRPERQLSQSPLAQVFLSYQNIPPLPRQLGPGLDLDLRELGNGTAKVDLTIYLRQQEGGLVSVWEYAAALFDAATLARWTRHFQVLLAAAAADPRRPIGDLPLLTPEERQQLLAGFNDTGSTAGPDVCLHQLFEAQAARVPDQVALIAPDARLTYRELNERAERLAHRLRALGLGPERLAGVLMDRTADLVVTLLAVHKAGGAYAPLDPNYPKSRVLLMLETARATVLVTRRRLAEAFADELPAGMSTVFLDPGWEDEPVEEREAPEALPDNLAYVIFTSGSTGVPKGVAIQHRSAVAMIRWAHAMYTPEEYAGMLASTSICFDMSVFEIFATLAAGGRILLAENALALPGLEARDEVALIDTVPSAMAELLRMGGLPPSVRTVNLGGEPLKATLVREIHERLPGVSRVVNLYGPSEDTTFTSFAVVPRDTDHPLIGRPLTGEQAYVLDREMRPVPIGVPGSLYMGGEGVTRGYLHRPDLTAERYVPSPYGPPGSRLYTVGDLVRHLPTGELDYLGRLDHQVKVRGFRIELGEIESALVRHPDVRQAAILAAPDVDGTGTRLIAWVETETDSSGLAGELRTFLQQSLPDYMVPAVFIPLARLPLTPNGKIDRRALAALPLQPEAVAADAAHAPRGYVEEVLAGIWSDIFGHPVYRNDSFFDLGGHSLLATRVTARVRSALNVELPLRRLFLSPVLKELAEWLGKEIEARHGVSMPPIRRAPRDGDLPLSFAQQRLWFLDRLEPGTATFNLPSPLRLTGQLDVGALSRALDEIVRRHEALRTVFPERDGRGVQRVQPPAPVPLPWIDLSGLPASLREPEARQRAAEEARLPFDLSRGPLLRATLLRLGAGEAVLLVTLHHIVTDGWSTGVFLRELRALYEAFAAGRPSPLPALPLQYPDFAVWQRSALSGEAVDALLADWTRRLGTEVPPLQMPTDRPRPAVQTYRGAYRSLQLSTELTWGIQKLAHRSGVTLFMALLAAFQALLHRYTGQRRVVVGSPVAGRNRPELEGLIGFFVNSLVLPADLSGDLTFHQLLERVREMALRAYAGQELPFEKLVEALQPVRDPSRSPLFQVMFLLQPADSPLAAPPDEGALHIEPYGVATGTSQFDLTLFAVEAPDGLHTGVEYNTDLFDAATMDRLLENYRSLLEAAVAGPEVKVGEIPLALPEPEPPRAAAPVEPAGAAAPTIDARRGSLASRLSRLSPAQREALERRLKGSAEAAPPAAPVAASCLVEIVPPAPGGGRRPFFCIHPAGGDALCFFPLARHTGADQPFYGLQARGLEDAAEPFATIEEMAAHYLGEIRRVQPRGPYRVGGWSFGGLAAFELARQLRAAGEEVELLAVLDTAPGVEDGALDPDPEAADDTGRLLAIAAYVKGLRGKDLRVTLADLQPLDPEARLRFFVARLQEAGIVHSGDSLAQLRRLLRVYATNVRAFRRYVPQPYDGRITLIRAEGAHFDPALGPDLGWERLSPHPVDRVDVPGDHITLLAEPHVRTLADRLRTLLGGSERP